MRFEVHLKYTGLQDHVIVIQLPFIPSIGDVLEFQPMDDEFSRPTWLKEISKDLEAQILDEGLAFYSITDRIIRPDGTIIFHGMPDWVLNIKVENKFSSDELRMHMKSEHKLMMWG